MVMVAIWLYPQQEKGIMIVAPRSNILQTCHSWPWSRVWSLALLVGYKVMVGNMTKSLLRKINNDCYTQLQHHGGPSKTQWYAPSTSQGRPQ